MTVNPDTSPLPQAALPEAPIPKAERSTGKQRLAALGVVLAILIILAIIVASIYFLLRPGYAETTAQIRDVFIIFLALESLLIGLVLVLLIFQLARLINLLQNEIKPILESTNETVSHLRGTTAFLGDNLVAPVIKLNEYLAGLSQLLQVIGLARKKPKN